jgi:hypothetical protein
MERELNEEIAIELVRGQLKAIKEFSWIAQCRIFDCYSDEIWNGIPDEIRNFFGSDEAIVHTLQDLSIAVCYRCASSLSFSRLLCSPIASRPRLTATLQRAVPSRCRGDSKRRLAGAALGRDIRRRLCVLDCFVLVLVVCCLFCIACFLSLG